MSRLLPRLFAVGEPAELPSSPYRQVMDEFDAMREIYDVLTVFGEPERRRIMECVNTKLRDEDIGRRLQEEQ